MRMTGWIGAIAGVGALLLAGCSGTTIYDIDGQYGVGTLRFVYDDNSTWTLRQTIIEVVEADDLIYMTTIARGRCVRRSLRWSKRMT